MKRKIISLLLILVMLATAASFAGCDKELEPDNVKRGMIYVTALMSGGLYDTSTGKPIWDPLLNEDVDLMDFLGEDMMVGVEKLVSTDMQNILGLLNAILSGSEDGLLKMITQDENGVPLNSNIQPVPFFDSNLRIKYGAINAYTESYNSLQARYGDFYEVSIFNYDWRIDNRINTERLDAFITERGYDEVVFLTHSMGGPVISGWLAESQENRDMTKLFCSFSSPYYGSLMALTILENPDDLIAVLTEMSATATGFVKTLLDMIMPQIDNLWDSQIMPLLTNMTSIYQLLPSYEMISNTGIDGLESFINVDDEPISSQEDLYEFYCSRDWALNSDGEVRKDMVEWLEYRDSMYVTLGDGSKVHATSLVNTVFWVGSNIKTDVALNYYEGELLAEDIVSVMEGDGTVPLYSGTVGLSKTAANVRLVDNAEHVQLGAAFDTYLKEACFAEIDKVTTDYIKQELAKRE